MLLIFESAENVTAIPEGFSLNKDYKTELDVKVKQDLLCIVVQNSTLLHPDLSFAFWCVLILFHLVSFISVYTKYILNNLYFCQSSFIIQRHHPNVLNGCLHKETVVAKLTAPSSLMCFIPHSIGTTQPIRRRRDPPSSVQNPNCIAENSTCLKMQICLMQNIGGMAREDIREVNYVPNANRRPKSHTEITGK